MSTYLKLVNDAMAEAKVTLDPLTSANFDNPPRTILYNRFKSWVARAYKELLLRRKEWRFRTERATLGLYPRLHLTNVAAAPLVGDTIRGQSTGVRGVVLALYTHEDVEGDGVTELTVALAMVGNYKVTDFSLRELVDIVSPGSTVGMARVKGIGTYNLRSEVANLAAVDEHSIRLIDPEDASSHTRVVLRAIPWGNWGSYTTGWDVFSGQPEYVTVTPSGDLQFYPYLDKYYIIDFEFSRKPSELVNWNDIPSEIPEEYQDYLLWKAVADFGDYDSNQRIYARTNKNLEQYLYWLERDHIEDPYFGPNRFYYLGI